MPMCAECNRFRPMKHFTRDTTHTIANLALLTRDGLTEHYKDVAEKQAEHIKIMEEDSARYDLLEEYQQFLDDVERDKKREEKPQREEKPRTHEQEDITTHITSYAFIAVIFVIAIVLLLLVISHRREVPPQTEEIPVYNSQVIQFQSYRNRP